MPYYLTAINFVTIIKPCYGFLRNIIEPKSLKHFWCSIFQSAAQLTKRILFDLNCGSQTNKTQMPVLNVTVTGNLNHINEQLFIVSSYNYNVPRSHQLRSISEMYRPVKVMLYHVAKFLKGTVCIVICICTIIVDIK